MEIYEQIEELEKKRIEYLEVEDKAGANRIRRKIEKLELEQRLKSFNKLQDELNIYKRVVRQYPACENEIKREMRESNWKKV